MARFKSLAALGAAAALFLSACAGSPAAQSGAAASGDGAASGTIGALQTLTPGKLTIATGEPAYSPWVENDKPESGEGFEAAIAYAIAEELGFKKEDVEWTRSTFEAAIAPGAKNWDFNLQQFTITEERKTAVDFSTPYYTTAQAVLTLKDNAAAQAKTIADLQKVQFGVQVGTVSAKTVTDIVKPEKDALILNNSVDVIQALINGQVDAIVLDLPTALYQQAVAVENSTIVGQFEATEDGDNFGLVLPKDSPITEPVSKAIDSLREKGTLKEIADKWLSANIEIPVLK